MARPPKTRTFHEQGRTLTLRDRGGHHELLIGEVPILTSAALGTERDFGRLSAKLWISAAPRVLVGGLGFGSTLAGVLEVAPPNAEIQVAEKLETVVRLATGELSPLVAGALGDPRVRLVREDVVDVIREARDLDVILLDVDNGPEWASFPENARLYDHDGLRAAHAALTPGGAFAVWSGYPADGFLRHLRGAGLRPSVQKFEEHGRVQARAYIGKKRR